MNEKILWNANLLFNSLQKIDINYTLDEISQKIVFFYQQILSALFGQTPIFISLKKLKKLPFNFDSFEFDYPSPIFISSCITKHVLVSQIGKIKTFLIIINEMIDFQIAKQRKREIFYKHTEHFHDQSELDEIFKHFFFLLKIRRSQLNVLNSPKGLVFGALSILVDGELLSLNQSPLKSSGQLISFEDFSVVHSKLRFVLVVEKETVFFSLLSQNFLASFPDALLVTGRGYPDFTTKRFLKQLTNQIPNCMFLYLGDFDPFGIDIFLNYLFSTPLTVFENNNVPTLYPIGMNYHDFGNFLKQPKLELSTEDLEKIEDILKLPFLSEPIPDGLPLDDFIFSMKNKLEIVKQNLEFMRFHVLKAEVEQIDADSGSLPEYLILKINILFGSFSSNF